jgi:sec-independent protein translocase protein TatA
MFNNIGSTEIIVVAVLILIFFGGKKLPEMAKGIGEAISEFKKSSKDDDKESKEAKKTEKKA